MWNQHRRFSILAMGLIVVVACGAYAQRPKKVVSATVRKVDTIRRILEIEIDRENYGRELKVAADASISISSQDVTLDKLKPGMRVTASVDFQTETITKILAKAPPKEKSEKEEEPEPAEGEPEGEEGDEKASAGKKKVEEEQIAANGELPNELSEVDDAVKEYLTDQKIRGAAVVVVKDGKCVMARGYGFADSESTAPAEPTTLFPIAGLSKIVTGIAALKLQEENKLDLRAKFVDLFQLNIPEEQQKLMKNSNFNKMQPYDLLKDNNLETDPFLKQMFGTVEGRKLSLMALRGLPDPEGFAFAEEKDYPFLDIEYLLLGRVIAKLAGGRYEPYVQRTMLEGLAANKPRVEIVGKVELEEKDNTKKRKRSGKSAGEQPEPFDGVADVRGEGSEPYSEPSMNFDSAGGWLFSAMDLARLTAALDETAKKPLLKPESVELLLSKPTSATKSDEKDEGKKKPAKEPKPNAKKKDDAPEKKRRGATSPHFSGGWQVLVPKGKEEPPAVSKLRRYARSGPANVASEDGLHVVILLTTPPKESKAGEHPLMVKVNKALEEVTSWPSVDYFETLPSEQPKESMPPEVASTPMPDMPTPQLPMVVGVANKIEATVHQVNSLYAEFLAAGGNKLNGEVRATSAGPGDFYKVGQKLPQAVAANKKLLDKLAELIPNALLMRTEVPQNNADQMDVVASMASYIEGRARAARALFDLMNQEAKPEEQRIIFQRLVVEEESALRWHNKFLQGFTKAFPRPVKASTNEADFNTTSEWLLSHLTASAVERDTIMANRRPRMDAITAKGGGATAIEQATLPILFKEINDKSKIIAQEQRQLSEQLKPYIEAEKSAGSSFLAKWEAAAALADAEAALTEFFMTLGTPASDASQGMKLITAVQEAKTRLAEAAKPAPAEATEPAQTDPAAAAPAQGDPATEPKPPS